MPAEKVLFHPSWKINLLSLHWAPWRNWAKRRKMVSWFRHRKQELSSHVLLEWLFHLIKSDESLPHAENQIERMRQAMVWMHICLHLDSKEAKHYIDLQITQGHREENQKEPRKNKQSPSTHLREGEGHPGQRTVLETVLKSTQVSSQHPSWHTNSLG